MSTISIFVFIGVAILIVALAIIENFSRFAMKKIFLDLGSAIIGLVIGALLSAPLSKLPDPYGEILPTVVTMISVFAAILLSNRLLPQIDGWLDTIRDIARGQLTHLFPKHDENAKEVIVDTSALIDARLLAITRAGFLAQKIIIPKFVLAELQNIADSKESDRRNKGRRGMQTLEGLKKIKKGELEIVSDDFEDIETVDNKLIVISKARHAGLVTTDYNLNKIASIQGVQVLNINELAQCLRPDLLPGDEYKVKIVHVGKDKTQGVGYLEDGTMIVVEDGSKLTDKIIMVKISRSIQTTAGKMYFARILHG